MSLQVLPEPSRWKAVDSVIIKETLFVIVSSRHYHVRGKASGKALSSAPIHLTPVTQFGCWAPDDGWRGEVSEWWIGACAVWKCSKDLHGMGQSNPIATKDSTSTKSHLTTLAEHKSSAFFWTIVINRRGRRGSFLVVLPFVLLLVCLCIMFLLIKGGIFIF